MMPGPYIDAFGDNPVKSFYPDFMQWVQNKDVGPQAWASGYGELAPDMYAAGIKKNTPEEEMMMRLIFAALGGAGPRGRYDEKSGYKTAKTDPLKRAQEIMNQ
jgi:hypothetical protein